MISGASVGSIITAIVCTRTKSEVDLHQSSWFCMINFYICYRQLEQLLDEDYEMDLDFFKRDELRDKIARLVNEGAFLDLNSLERCIRANVADLTFEEAHDRTGMVRDCFLLHL